MIKTLQSFTRFVKTNTSTIVTRKSTTAISRTISNRFSPTSTTSPSNIPAIFASRPFSSSSSSSSSSFSSSSPSAAHAALDLTYSLNASCAVTPLPNLPSSPTLDFECTIPSKYSIGEFPNGGQLAYTAVLAGSMCTVHPDILSLHCTYLKSPKQSEKAVLKVTSLSKGKTSDTINITMNQNGHVLVAFVLTFGNQDANNERAGNFTIPTSQSIPLPTEHLSNATSDASELFYSTMGNDCRIAKQNVMMVDEEKSSFLKFWRTKQQAIEAVLIGHAGTKDKQPIDSNILAYLLDAFPPVVIALAPSAWVPTISYNVYFFSRPRECLTTVPLKFETNVCEESVLETKGTAWDLETGRVIATSTQMARVWNPKGGK